MLDVLPDSMPPTLRFAVDGYAHLPGFLDAGVCAELTAALRNLIDTGKTRHDPQCPGSDAIHSADAPVFDKLLEDLIPNFEEASGKRLLPTYAYARLYRPGEVLTVHKDRSSCEISATITLGFAGKPWPIFMADGGFIEEEGKGHAENVHNVHQIEMAIGDAVLYRGCEKLHWREAFEGEWQAQVFLHYVDADGPNAEWKWDKRNRLSHHPSLGHGYFVSVPDAVDPASCANIIAKCEAVEGESASIGGGGAGVVNKTIRDVSRVPLPIFRGIGATMAGIGLHANRNAWRFDVSHANQAEFLRYDEAGHYHAHIDTFFDPAETECRKLTVLLFLNDDFEGGRFFVQAAEERMYPPQSPGTVLIFPSFMVHGVEPVTKGVRRSLVTWLVGPWFR